MRTKVLASTGNTQTPWDSSSLTGRFYFKPPDTTQTAAVTPPPAPAADDEKLQKEKSYWESVKDSNDPDEIEVYLAKYPNGFFVDAANVKLAQLKGSTTQVASAGPASAMNAGMRNWVTITPENSPASAHTPIPVRAHRTIADDDASSAPAWSRMSRAMTTADRRWTSL